MDLISTSKMTGTLTVLNMLILWLSITRTVITEGEEPTKGYPINNKRMYIKTSANHNYTERTNNYIRVNFNSTDSSKKRMVKSGAEASTWTLVHRSVHVKKDITTANKDLKTINDANITSNAAKTSLFPHRDKNENECHVDLCVDTSELKDHTGNPCPEIHMCLCGLDKHNRQFVDCSERNLTEIPSSFPNETEYIFLAGNEIKAIPIRTFQNLQNLKFLDLSRNTIEKLDADAFLGLHFLCCLKLNGNKLRYTKFSISYSAFKPLDNLIYLDLQQNLPNITQNESYPTEALSHLKELRILHMDGLSENSWKTKDFQSLRNLHNLTLSGKLHTDRCSMNSVKRGMFKYLSTLKSLKLENCRLKRVENGSFGELHALNSLDLSENENLTFRSLENITYALRDKKMYLLNLTKIHPTFGDCVRISATNLKYMSNMTIENFILDSNRLAFIEEDAVDSFPNLTGFVSLKDNLILLGKYVISIIQYDKLANVRSLTMSDQMTNHNIQELIKPDTHQFLQDFSHDQNETAEEFSLFDSNIHKRINKRNYPGVMCPSCGQFHDVTPYNLPSNIRVLDMSNMKSRYPLRRICVCEPNSFRDIDLHRNVFYRIEGPFYGLANLTSLDVSWNACEYMSSNALHEMTGLRYLNLSRNFLGISFNEDTNGDIFREQSTLISLDISENRIRRLPRKFFKGLIKVETLFLRNNLMYAFNLDMSSLSKLKYLDLSVNFLVYITNDVLRNFRNLATLHNFTIDLALNNLSCSCSQLQFVKWIATSRVNFQNLKSSTCSYENGETRNLTMASPLYEELSIQCQSYTTVIFVCTVGIVLLITILTVVIGYRYRWNLRYFYYSAKMRMKGYSPIKSEEDEVFDHNVFISFADEDKSFVRELIIPELEEKRQLQLLIHDRDFRPGEFVHDNILTAICTSKKTLIVMSKAFLQSVWCRFEMNMARMEAIKTGRNVLAIIMMEDVPVAGLPLEIVDTIREQTYLEWPHEEIHREQFWERLYQSLK